MKTRILIAVMLVALVGILGHSQSVNSAVVINAPVGLASSCPAPALNAFIQCPTTDQGLLVSIGGAAYFQVAAQSGSGSVKSWNSRTGAVMPASGDYKFSDLTALPTTGSCTSFTVQNGSISLSGCTFK